MDVNRDNFYDVLPSVLNDIHDADFVAIDGEFSGILAFDRMNYFDTPAERYQRHYQVEFLLQSYFSLSRSFQCDRHYRMLQMGLAMVKCTNAAEHK